MKCPICEAEGCKKVEREAANKLFEYECVKCEEFYVEKDPARLLEIDFDQILRQYLGDNNKGIFEILHRNENGQYALFHDSESKAAWAEYLPDLPPDFSGTGRPMGGLDGIHSKEEAFRESQNKMDSRLPGCVVIPEYDRICISSGSLW
jgi:hypothetical protein